MIGAAVVKSPSRLTGALLPDEQAVNEMLHDWHRDNGISVIRNGVIE